MSKEMVTEGIWPWWFTDRGPTPRVMRAMSAPTVGHLDPLMVAMLDDVRSSKALSKDGEADLKRAIEQYNKTV